jgi:Cu/Ag efflux protein CusF
MRQQANWLRVVFGVILIFTASIASAQQGKAKEHEFKGKVEKVDVKAKTVTVNGENVPGWMGAMTMTYGVDKDAVLGTLKAGDQITAKVYDGDFKTLHDVKMLPPKDGKAPPKK